MREKREIQVKLQEVFDEELETYEFGARL